jgi:hypothetical protein
LKTELEIFPDGAGNPGIFVLHFSRLLGIKRVARVMIPATRIFVCKPADVIPISALLRISEPVALCEF